MTLLAWPALLMLGTVGILLALAMRGAGPRRRDVGTLLIWARVSNKRAQASRPRREYDLLLWLLLGAVVLGSVAAARPAWLRAETWTRIAVYVEPTGPGFQQMDLEDVRQRAQARAPEALITLFLPGLDAPESRTLAGGPVHAELAQFERAAADFDARILFLNAPTPHAEQLGLVLPRVNAPRMNVVFSVSAQGDHLIVKRGVGDALRVEGADLLKVSETGREATWVFQPNRDAISLPITAADTLRLQRNRFVVGVGPRWTSDAHSALYQALGPDDAAGESVDVWLGGDEGAPAVRIVRGQPHDLSSAGISLDPGHSLFRDLPLGDFDWTASGRVMPLDGDARPLIRAVVDGEPVGDVARVRGNVVEFAGDPFTQAPVASSALLLDNAIGVATGRRPSEREQYSIVGDTKLPARRAALAAPFPPEGSLDLSSRRAGEYVEASTWLMVVAALAMLGAGALVITKKAPGTPGALVRQVAKATGSGPRQP